MSLKQGKDEAAFLAYLALRKHHIRPSEFITYSREEQAFFYACEQLEQEENQKLAERQRKMARRGRG